MLAKISLGINALLIIAVIILFTRGNGGSESADEEGDSTKVEINTGEAITIAYFNNDSLNQDCQFVVDVQEEIQTVTNDAQNKIYAKENEITKWQQKWEAKGDLLPREMQQAQEEGAKLQEEYAMLQQQVQVEMAEKTNNLMMTMYNRITKYATTFCEKNSIDMLMAYQLGGDVIYINKDLDVTNQFIAHVNKEYSGGSGTEEAGAEEN